MKFIDKVLDAPVRIGDQITDGLGRTWVLDGVVASTARTPAIVVARRIVSDKPVKRQTNFALGMFPGYRVSVAK